MRRGGAQRDEVVVRNASLRAVVAVAIVGVVVVVGGGGERRDVTSSPARQGLDCRLIFCIFSDPRSALKYV